MKHLIATILIAGTFTLPAPAPLACVCFVPDIPKAVERAGAVFVGEVIDIIEPRTFDEHAPLAERFSTIKFKVEKSWKGVASDDVQVLSGQGKIGCFDYPPVNKGEKYLVYAGQSNQKGWLIITSCNRTALIPKPGSQAVKATGSEFNRKDASNDLKELEAMRKSGFFKSESVLPGITDN